MHKLIINVSSLDDLVVVRRAIEAACLGCVITQTGDGCWKVETQHSLSVRLVRLYNQLTGRKRQHLGTPCVMMYSNL